jgi:ElaB/YqjD/DUF883 family membrane-anchored ribosome-binding protein
MTTTRSQTLGYPSDQVDDLGPARFRDVKDDVSQLKQDVTKCAADAAHTGMEAVRSGAAHAAEAGRKIADTTRSSYQKACAHVEAHPMSSVLIAAGVGAIVARLLPRR